MIIDIIDMKNIIFWVGYYSKTWCSNMYPGGSEKATVNIAEELAHNNNVYIIGDVIEGIYNRVNYIHRDNLDTIFKYNKNKFYLIGVNYINFINHFNVYIDRIVKKIFYVHNTEPFKFYNDRQMDKNEIDNALRACDTVVCVSYFHQKQFSTDYNLDNTIAISHGIKPTGVDLRKKVKDRFIWMSSADRGLGKYITETIPLIKAHLHNSEFIICTPEYSLSWFDKDVLPTDYKQRYNIKYLGNVLDIKHILETSEYMVYVTDYIETFCMSVYEANYYGVKVITSDKGALTESNVSGKCIKEGELLDTITKMKYIEGKLFRTWVDVAIKFNSIL